MRKPLFLTLFIFLFINANGQVNFDLSGYWHNWNEANVSYLNLNQTNTQYSIVNVSFAEPKAGTNYDMEFIPYQVSQVTLIQQIQNIQAQGRKVLLSVGGAGTTISLDSTYKKNAFVSSMLSIINTFGFDGIDLFLEGNSLNITGGTISNPVDSNVIHIIDAVKLIMSDYRVQNNKKMMLTLSARTESVQGALSTYSGASGAYLPLIESLKDSLNILHLHLYNSAPRYGLDSNLYNQGTSDFIVAMTEAAIQGFTTSSGTYSGLPPEKVSIGLPACSIAGGGGGYPSPQTITDAISYLRGLGTKPGFYTLVNPNGYFDIKGLTIWSINWDALLSCGGTYWGCVNYYKGVFNIVDETSDLKELQGIKVYPNPANKYLNVESNNLTNYNIKIYNLLGKMVYQNSNHENQQIDISNLAPSIYVININGQNVCFFKTND